MSKNKSYPHLLKENVNFRDLVIKMMHDQFPSLGPDLVLIGKSKIFLRI